MYLNYLILGLASLLCIDYFFFFNKRLSTPAFLFNVGFFICAAILKLFENVWHVKLHEDTFLLILSGNISISLASFLMRRESPSIREIQGGDQPPSSCIIISIEKLKLFFCLQFFNALLKIYLLLRYYGTGSVAVALFMHTEAIKSEGNAMEYPIGLGFVSNTIEIMAGIIPALCAFYLSSSYISKRHKVWMSINAIFAMVFSLLSSGRTFMLYYLIIFCSIYMMTFYCRGKVFPIKKIVLYCIGGYLFLFAFQQLGYLIGREKNDSTAELVIGVYCGAEILNLDDLIHRQTDVPPNQYWGNQTFYLFYDQLQTLGLAKLKYTRRDYHPFNVAGGYGIGNVASAFQDYYFDFGLFGTIVICFLIGLIMEYIHQKSLKSYFFRNGIVDFWLMLYIIFIPAIFMSFFSEQFFKQLANILSLKYWLKLVLLFYLFYGFTPFKLRKEYKK